MKKNILLSAINWILVFSIPGILLTSKIDSNTVYSSINTKNLNTNLFQEVANTNNINNIKNEKENKEEIEEIEIPDIEKEEKITPDETKKEEKVSIVEEESKQEVKDNTVKEQPETKNQVSQSSSLVTYLGKASYYTANCYGCGGYTSSGLNVSDGRTFYNDSVYGNVRIIAAGKEIPLYSIVRINNTSLGSNVLAIVLDRGGDIGQDRKFLIDILTNSSEGYGGVDKGVSVEVLRSGR